MPIHKQTYIKLFAILALWVSMAFGLNIFAAAQSAETKEAKPDYIKWVNFNIPSTALNRAAKYDIETCASDIHVGWVELLAVLGAKYGGDWKNYKPTDMDKAAERLKAGESGADIMGGYKNFGYFLEAYGAVLSGFLGEYRKDMEDNARGLIVPCEKYGLKAFSPIAEGFPFSHYRDFGDSRGYGYSRPHLGNDLMGSVGTPIIAVEGGVVEELGWNRYGGWRVGIRSFDSKRYYFYAHMRKDRPFAAGLAEGARVQAGDVIGYMGMTGYSVKENVNNMKVPHLHFGLQLIFDESQKDGDNEIWVDVYDIVEFLRQNRATVTRNEETKEYARRYPMYDKNFPPPGQKQNKTNFKL